MLLTRECCAFSQRYGSFVSPSVFIQNENPSLKQIIAVGIMEVGLLWLGTLLAVLLRWVVSTFPYSGQGKSPMFGDYEAQRHWMEITVNLPVNEWYQNSSKNDLLYWGLDYPPLTAYHSLLCGLVADSFNQSWVALGSSRGCESYHHKLFMRYTVLLADVILYMPAVIIFFWYSVLKERIKTCAAVAMLLYPGLILIDHGHFQYNCVSLGFFVWAVTLFERSKDVLGSVAFVLALNYKQMELYHALPVFCYLLGRCSSEKDIFWRIFKFVGLGFVVSLTFIVCWLPFLSDIDVTFQVVRRIFPFDRGLFEDKVANIWCSFSILIKLKQLFSYATLAKMSAVITLVMMLPSSINLLLKPSLARFKLALVNSALIFFLCSFQVHEKSVLLAAIPVCLIFSFNPFICSWFLLMSTFSMWPLFLKDHLIIPYFAVTTIYTVVVWRAFVRDFLKRHYDRDLKLRFLFLSSLLGCILINLASVLVTSPTRYPDIFAVATAVYSCFHFILFTVYFHWLQFMYVEDKFVRYVPVKLKTK